MRLATLGAPLILVSVAFASAAEAGDDMCPPLRDFVASVGAKEKRSLEFHTMWGGNFKGETEPAIFAKQCNHFGYLGAKNACAYLMKHGVVEFAFRNALRAVSCISPKTRFDPSVSVHRFWATLQYGSSDRGAFVEVDFKTDKKLGGMVLEIHVDGY